VSLQHASLADLILAARYVLAQPKNRRAERCKALIAHSHQATEYMQLTGRAHALYGDGSISSYALRLPLAPMPAQLNEAVFDALTLVIEQLCEHAKPKQ
jgi:hypothetical protein